MRAAALPFSVCILLVASAYSVDTALAGQSWVEVKTPNFTVVSNAGQKRAQQAALRLEQFRAAFEQAFPGFRLNSAEPILVVGAKDEDTMKELLPEYWTNPTGLHPAFVFHSGWEQSVAVVRLDLDHSFDYLDGDYVYQLLDLNFVRLPNWLRTGISQFFIPTEITEHEVKLGMPSRWESYLRRKPSPPISLLDLLKEKPAAVTKNRWLADDFQAESWALTHMLILGPNLGNGAKLDEFIQRLTKESDQVKAFEETFGKVNDVYLQLDHYIRQPGLNVLGMKNPPKVETINFISRDLRLAETATYFAALELGRASRKEPDEWLDAALKDNPGFAPAHRLRGFSLFNQGKDEPALAEFSKAAELDPKDYLAKYFVAMMKYDNPKNDAENSQLAQGLKEVRSLNPNFAPVHVELSYAYLRNRQLDRALQAAQFAEQLEPGRAGYHSNVARIMLVKGDAAGAAALARFVAERWTGTDRDQAIEIWQDAAAKNKSLASPPLDVQSDALEGSSLKGTIVSAECGDREKKQASELVIRDGDKLVHLHGDMEKPMRIGFEDTLWYGHNHFNFCRHVNGRTVAAIYKPSGENEGTIMQLRIEDELPAELTATKTVGQ